MFFNVRWAEILTNLDVVLGVITREVVCLTTGLVVARTVGGGAVVGRGVVVGGLVALLVGCPLSTSPKRLVSTPTAGS